MPLAYFAIFSLPYTGPTIHGFANVVSIANKMVKLAKVG